MEKYTKEMLNYIFEFPQKTYKDTLFSRKHTKQRTTLYWRGIHTKRLKGYIRKGAHPGDKN